MRHYGWLIRPREGGGRLWRGVERGKRDGRAIHSSLCNGLTAPLLGGVHRRLIQRNTDKTFMPPQPTSRGGFSALSEGAGAAEALNCAASGARTLNTYSNFYCQGPQTSNLIFSSDTSTSHYHVRFLNVFKLEYYTRISSPGASGPISRKIKECFERIK